MKMISRAAVALSILAITGSGIASAAEQMMPPVATVTIPATFGSLPVAAWSWGVANSGTSGAGSGGGAGKASIQDLSITRLVDSQSPLFFRVAARGEHLPAVALVDGPTTVMLTDVLITGYATEDRPPGNNGTRIENITFSFARIEYSVNGVTSCFNFTTNTSC
jgi:type VI protein secretion system component Hcp